MCGVGSSFVDDGEHDACWIGAEFELEECEDFFIFLINEGVEFEEVEIRGYRIPVRLAMDGWYEGREDDSVGLKTLEMDWEGEVHVVRIWPIKLRIWEYVRLFGCFVRVGEHGV